MTYLSKPVRREFLLKPNWASRGTYIITLLPEGKISFREKGKKKGFAAYLLNVLDLAIRTEMVADYKTRMKEYEKKKSAGYKRLRKPSKPDLRF